MLQMANDFFLEHTRYQKCYCFLCTSDVYELDQCIINHLRIHWDRIWASWCEPSCVHHFLIICEGHVSYTTAGFWANGSWPEGELKCKCVPCTYALHSKWFEALFYITKTQECPGMRGSSPNKNQIKWISDGPSRTKLVLHFLQDLRGDGLWKSFTLCLLSL